MDSQNAQNIPGANVDPATFLDGTYLEDLKKTNGKPIHCKAAVAWEAKKPLDVCVI